MRKNFAKQLFARLSQAVSERRFLQRFSLSRKAALALLHSEDWEEKFTDALNPEGRIDCGHLLSLAQSTLDQLSPTPEEGWLAFCYRFAINGMFPDEGFSKKNSRYSDGALFFLTLLEVCLDVERQAAPFAPELDIDFLGEEEIGGCSRAEEYRKFVACWRQEHVGAMMRLGDCATPYRTLGHIAGVHFVSMTVARGLKAAGAPIDLALVSGAAAAHDLGKFGCKPGERVPYLHYYYTARWCVQRGLENIAHVAANHSVWDLELENLPVESLALIYADFRVKQMRDESGAEITKIYPLDESFQVILDKLDNVDTAKRRRYRYVYAKLRDFEEYMVSMGVDVELDGVPGPREVKRDVALMSSQQAVRSLKFLGIEHNIGLMSRLGDERQFGNILEAARSEKQWKNIRAYLSIFEEYSTYLSLRQKLEMLDFLYELLMHREGDIRRQAAALIGGIIANFNAGYRKELPEGATPAEDEPDALEIWQRYLKRLILTDHRLTDQHKRWIGYTLKIVTAALFEQLPEQKRGDYFRELMPYYSGSWEMGYQAAFVMLDVVPYLPLELCTGVERRQLFEFARSCLPHASLELRAAAMRALRYLMEQPSTEPELRRDAALLADGFDDDGNFTLCFLKGRLLRACGRGDDVQRAQLEGRDVISDIFLDNLKTATPWIIKAVNIKLLLDCIDRGDRSRLLHIAAHLSNLVKVSERIVVRHNAGAALLRIAPLLSLDQRNEIAVELLKGLEVDGYEFSKYIPQYLGEFALWLYPDELDEIIRDLRVLSHSANERVVSVALATVGALLEGYPEYRERFDLTVDNYRRRRERLLGMLLKGLANFREGVRQEALLVLGGLFGSKRLSEHERRSLFNLACQKMLFLVQEYPDSELTFYYRAAALNHIYRFIADQTLERGGFSIETREKIAFFPGTFDPFTLSHKGIVQEIRDLGFEVVLSLDEFSWSKKTQPRLYRRRIVGMSIADEFHVHLFPDGVPVNIANPADLRRLREAFDGRELYMVVGSDVVANASSYRVEPTPDSIHHMNHIIFDRVAEEDEGQARTPMDAIDGIIIKLRLPPHLEDISSTRIRESIDQNRDIQNLIDPVAQDFIYQNSLYLREPQYKPILRARAIIFESVSLPNAAVTEELSASVLVQHPERETILRTMAERRDGVVVIRNGEENNRPVGFATVRSLGSQQLYSELGDVRLADEVRRMGGGKILLIGGIYALRDSGIAQAEQMLLTETLVQALAKDCGYALFFPEAAPTARTLAVLEQQGFVETQHSAEGNMLLWVDMRSPIVLFQNLETTIKEPLCSNPRVLAVIEKTYHKLQRAMVALTPGSLVLSLPAGVIYHRLVDRITAINGVPSEPTVPRRLGEAMCVPFGKILRGNVVPNTVTKTLHTDKVFSPDLGESSIEAYHHYSSLESQIRTIQSFNRPVILVDDLMHGGDRIRAIAPLMRKEGIEIKTVLVGLLSGLGRDLMEQHGGAVDCVYYLPNLRHWFIESTLYPFIGGDTVRREQMPVSGLQASINMILPYAFPDWAVHYDHRAVFELSLCCIENARDILRVLEAEYRSAFGRNLTLNRLSEAVILPLAPDRGGCVGYDANLSASVYLENDREMLLRTRELVI